MAANTRVHVSPGWAQNEIVTSAQLNTLDTNAANSVNRLSTKSGWRDCGLVLSGMGDWSNGVGSITVAPTCGRILLANGDNDGSLWTLPNLPIGHRLKYVRAHFSPQSGHAAQPTALPGICVHSISGSGADEFGLWSMYTWVSTSTYELGFWLQSNDLASLGFASALSIAADRRYCVTISHERMTNSKACYLDSIQAYCEVNTAQGGPDFTHWA